MPDANATKGVRFGLAGKIFLASALLVAVVLGVTFGVTSFQANRTADASIQRALAATRTAVEDFLATRIRTLGGLSTVATNVPQYRERLLKHGERADALDQCNDVRDLIGAAWVLVTDNQGLLIARTDYPEQLEVDLSGAPLVANALSGETSSGAWLDDVRNKLFIAVGTPLRASPDAASQGALIATFEVNDSLAQAIHQATSSDVVFFALDTLDHPYVVGSTLPRDEITAALQAGVKPEELAKDSAGEAMTAQSGREHLIGLAGAIRSPAGDLRGGFVAFRSRDAELAAFRTLQRTILAAILFGIVLALASAFVLARHIARPVQQLARATRRVQDGDYSVEIPVVGQDEIGVLSQAFRNLVDDLKEKAQLVDYMMQAAGASATQPLDSARTAVRQVGDRPSLGSGGDALRPGSVFAGRYEVKEVLGSGGMGVVYRAFDRELGEPVAIKTLRPDTVAGDPIALERFKQEIRLARKISHRNVVRTYDLGEINGLYYLTMEFVEGRSLKALIQSRGRLPVPVTLTIGKQLSRALEVAHEQGVIHRDIKPQNIVVEPNGFLKVMDFGIARLANPPKGKGLTEAGMAIGTPDYMSPEQLSGLELDPRSDLYSTGVVLFECLTGRLPFEADTPWTLIAKHIEEAAPDPRAMNAEIPDALAQVVLRAMAKDREGRYQTARELHDALEAIG
jgi:eukaryotic-like serine/threonine-protein kinase